jgi:urea transport system ATP-binding protein
VLLGFGFVLVTLFRAQGHRRAVRPADVTARTSAPIRVSALLEVSGVSVSFDGFKAINNLSFEIGPAELRAIIGPNGAGKTTFMDIVTGKTRPDEGRVRSGARRAARSAQAVGKPDRARRGRPQVPAPTVFEDQSVRDNLLMALKQDRAAVRRAALPPSAEDAHGCRRSPRRSAFRASSSTARRASCPRAEAMAGDRHAAGAGSALLLVDEPAAGMTLGEREHTTDLLRGGRRPARSSWSNMTWNSSAGSIARSRCCTKGRFWPKARSIT